MADSIIRGQTVSILSTVTIDGVAVDLSTVAAIKTMLKLNARDQDSAALITKTIGLGVTVTNPTVGQCTTIFTASDTNGLPTENKFYYETQVKLADGTILRSGINELIVLGSVQKTLL